MEQPPIVSGKLYTCLLISTFYLIITSSCLYAAITPEKTKWRNGATAAYSIIHDDLCSGGADGTVQYADTIAYNRGLVISGGALVSSCVSRHFWDYVNTMFLHGHEIISHSWSHTDATEPGWDPEQEFVRTKVEIETYVPGAEVTFFIFPEDHYNDQNLLDLKAAGYLGARAGPRSWGNDRGVTTNFNNFDPLGGCIFWDVWGPEYSIYNDDNCLKMHVDAAIATTGWSLQELHGVQDNSWETCPLEEYRSLLDYVKSKVDVNEIWMGTPTQVCKYIVTFQNCGTPSVNSNTILLFSSSDAVDSKYATAITVLLTTTTNPQQVTATQNGTELPVEKLGTNSFSLAVDPTRGEVQLSTTTATVFNYFLMQKPSTITRHQHILSVSIPAGAYTVHLVTVKGQRVKDLHAGYSHGGEVSIPLRLSNISSGLYLLRINHKEGIVVQKIFLSE